MKAVAVERLERGGQVYLFHPDHLALIEASPEAERAHRQLLAGSVPEDREVLEELWAADLVRRGASTAGRPLRHAPLRTLVLTVSQSCNLACRYCFATGPGVSKAGMSFETARKAVDFLLASAGSQERLSLVFFGGEPLLNFELIRQTVDYARSQAGKAIGFSLTTNGTLVKPAHVEFLEAHRFGVTVSLDGPPEVHDLNRPRHDGRGSFEAAARGTRLLLEGLRSRPVGARVTLARGQSLDLPGMLDFLLELGFAEAGFSPASDAEFGLEEAELEQVLAGFETLTQRYLQEARQGRRLGFANLRNLLRELREGQPRPYACGAGQGLLSVGTGGDLYLCHRFTGQPEFRLGSLEGLDTARVAAWSQRLHSDARGCQHCWLRRLCAGGCYHESAERQGEAAAPNHHLCDFLRRWTRLGLETYLALWQDCPEMLKETA